MPGAEQKHPRPALNGVRPATAGEQGPVETRRSAAQTQTRAASTCEGSGRPVTQRHAYARAQGCPVLKQSHALILRQPAVTHRPTQGGVSGPLRSHVRRPARPGHRLGEGPCPGSRLAVFPR